MNMLQLKLTESVTDSSLKTLNEFEFFISGDWHSTADNNKLTINITSGQQAVIRIADGDVHFTDSTNSENLGKSITITGGSSTNIYFSAGYAKILISNKNNIRSFAFPSGRNVVLTNDINYLGQTSLNYMTLTNCFFENPFDASKYTALIEFRLSSPTNEVNFKLSDFKRAELLQLLGSKVNIIGSIEDLSSLTKLYLFRGPVKSGAAEDLFDELFSNGKVSGTLTLYVSGGGVTYNGQVVQNSVSATFSSTGWTIGTIN